MTLQELQEQVLQLPLQDRWQLVQHLLGSIQQDMLSPSLPAADASAFPEIQHRTDSDGQIKATIRGTSIRVQTIVIASHDWGWDASRVANEYSLSVTQVSAALAFYESYKPEIDAVTGSEVALEAAANG